MDQWHYNVTLWNFDDIHSCLVGRAHFSALATMLWIRHNFCHERHSSYVHAFVIFVGENFDMLQSAKSTKYMAIRSTTKLIVYHPTADFPTRHGIKVQHWLQAVWRHPHSILVGQRHVSFWQCGFLEYCQWEREVPDLRWLWGWTNRMARHTKQARVLCSGRESPVLN